MIRKRSSQKKIPTPKTEVDKTKLTIRYLYLAAVKGLPVHHPLCRLYFPFGPLIKISDGILRNQKIIIGLDSFSNQRLIYLAQF